jgi:hypothetical protein
MADIDNAQTVRFCNEKLRVLADALSTAYYTAVAVTQAYYADPDIATTLSADASAAILDGAATDGRPIVTCADALNLITRASELVADYEANSNAKLNSVLAAAVNGLSKA